MDLLHLHCIGMVFALDSFANELSTRKIEKKPSRKTSEIQVFSIKKKKNLWDSNSGILNLKHSTEYLQFLKDVGRSTKPVDVVLVMSLHIYWKVCYFDSMSSKYLVRKQPLQSYLPFSCS